MKKTYRQIKYGTYAEGDTAVTLRSMSGDYGGGSEVLIIETYALGVAENAKKSDIASTLRVKEPYGGRSLDR